MSLPNIVIGEADLDRLSNLVLAASSALPEATDLLERELARARVVAPTELPEGVVAMGSEVTFRDEQSGQVRTVQLVYPKDADIDGGRLSVLTPVGAALLGLSAGQSMRWISRAGIERELTVLKVTQPR